MEVRALFGRLSKLRFAQLVEFERKCSNADRLWYSITLITEPVARIH